MTNIFHNIEKNLPTLSGDHKALTYRDNSPVILTLPDTHNIQKQNGPEKWNQHASNTHFLKPIFLNTGHHAN